MSQPYPSSSQPARPVQPDTPVPVLTAVKLMYAGAAVSAVTLVISLALVPAVKAALRKATPSLTTAQVSDVNVLITLAMLFGLATLELITVGPRYPGGYLAHFAVGGHVYSVIHSVFGATVLGLIVPVLLWLTGAAVVWLLWRPASSAFFKPQGAGRG